jgi:hypothetical protein
MNSSLKIGALSGVIAGFAAAIVAVICQDICLAIGFPYAIIWTTPPNLALVHIVVGIIWGAIFGIIYSKGYGLVAGKGLSKGLLYGMIIFLFTNIRDATFYVPYGIFVAQYVPWLFIGFFMWAAYGLLLEILYGELHVRYRLGREGPKIKTYDMKGGIHPGAIAGLAGGIAAFLSRILGGMLGIFEVSVRMEGGRLITITPTPFTGLAGVHIILNMIWGTIAGVLYPVVYNLVPAKGVTKGLYYGLIFFLVTSFRTTVYYLGWGDMNLTWMWGFVGIFQVIAYGLVLGALYRK